MSKMRVFVLTHNYPEHEKDMSGIFIKNILADLEDDFEFTICPIRFGGTMHKLYKNPLKWPRLISYYSESYNKAMADFRIEKFDLIWAHWWMPPGIMAAHLSRKFKCPLVVTCHGTDAFMLRDLPILRPLAKRVFGQSSMVNVVSKYMATITTMNSVVANMPYNQEVFSYQGKQKDDTYLICPSALIKRKNLDVLIKAVSQMPELRLKIFGNGILKEKLAAMIGNAKNIELNPAIDQAGLAQEYGKAGAVILPSINEGFGLTLVEGAACGCFPLATRDGGMVEIIEQTKGLLFPHDSSGEEIKNSLRKYLESLPIDRHAIANAARKYSREAIIPRFRQMLQDAIR